MHPNQLITYQGRPGVILCEHDLLHWVISYMNAELKEETLIVLKSEVFAR